MEGKGTYQYPNGSSYEGEFHNGLKHGEGLFYSKNGNFFEGKWK